MTAESELRQNRLNARKALENFGDCTFKPESSAKWINIVRNWTGKLSVKIQHDSIKNVTPEMMKWWFENLAGTTNWNGIDFKGPEISFYHLWHHRDHIKISPLSNKETNKTSTLLSNSLFLPKKIKMFQIRIATEKDIPTIFDLIKKLAVYEKLENDVVTSEEELAENIFAKNFAKVLIAEESGNPVGFALYFYNFSTFVGKPGIYLEDLFIEPEHRGKGYGKALLIELAKIAEAGNCGRFEWSVLDWNTPSIEFYKALGAKPMEEWTVFRLDKKGIHDLSVL